MNMDTKSTQDALPVCDYWDGLVTEVEASDYLCQSTRTLQKWRVSGFGPVFYKPGRSVRYRRRDLANWVATRARKHTSQH